METDYFEMQTLVNDMARKTGVAIDFEILYSPSQEDYELALDLNAGKRITDGRTRGAKMLKKLRQKAWEEFAAHPKNNIV